MPRARTPLITLLACGAALGAAGPAGSAGVAHETKLVRGPIAFRLTGWQHADPTTSLGDYRYAIAFKLDRDPQGRLRAEGVDGYRVTRGDFALDGYDTGAGHLYPPKHAPAGKAHCFVGYVDDAADVNPAWLRKEGRKRLGTKVRVRLQPLDRGADGKNAYGTRYVRHPRLQEADVELKSAAARRALARIGC